LTVQQDGDGVGGDLDGVDGQRPAIERNAPAGSMAFEFNDT